MALETAYGCGRGRKLWRVNPKSGSGMEQGRSARGGSRRQEVEKTWRRRRTGKGEPGQHAASPGRETLKGTKPQGSGCRKCSAETRAPGFWETEASMQRLGAWAASEEEPKPRRGSREQQKCFSGAWNVKTLKPNPRGRRARGERRTNDDASVFRLKTLQGTATSREGRTDWTTSR
jgi:hypothetical protein